MCLDKAVRVQPREGSNRMVSCRNSVLMAEKGIPIDKNGRDGSHNRYLDFKTAIIRGGSGEHALSAARGSSPRFLTSATFFPRSSSPARMKTVSSSPRRYIDPTGTTFPYA